MSDATNGDAEGLPEHKVSCAVEESGEAGKERRWEEKKVQEEIPEILNPDDFISKPILSKKCTVPEAILAFQYPFLLRLDTLIDYYQMQEHCAMLLDLCFKNKFISSFLNKLHWYMINYSHH
jgi:hypothetical protein